MVAHWYDKDGEPRHYEGKNGAGTTLREARKLDLYPSVTTILGVVSKPALTNWLQEEAAMMAAEMVTQESEPGMITLHINDREWAKQVVAATEKRTKAKADAGTAVHAVLEDYFSGKGVPVEHMPMCEAVDALVREKTGLSEWVTEERFCNVQWGFAGTCDLHNSEWIVDFKTKDEIDSTTKGWPEQADQLAAYRYGLFGKGSVARMANVFISRSVTTQCVWHEHKDDMAWERFRHALMYWQVSKKFGPYYERVK